MLVQKSRACSSAGLPDFIPKFRGSIVVSIPACHAGDPGSIPGPGVLFLLVNPRASKKSQVLPGLEPGLQGSKPWVLTNYTIEPCLRANFERLSLYKTKKQSKKVGSLIGHPAHVSTPTRFELARAEPIGFQNQLLNHSDTVSPTFIATAEFSTGKKLRHRRDLNSRGQSPVDFESTSLTTRTRCLVRKHRTPLPTAKRTGRSSRPKNGSIANPSFDLGTFRLRA